MRGASKVWLLVIAGLALLPVLPFTAPGSRLLIEVLDRLPGLELSYADGSLGGQLSLTQVALEGDGVSVLLSDVSVRLDLACLIYSEICLTQLRLGSVLVDVFATATEAVEIESTQTRQLVFPVAVSADQFSIDTLQVRWPGGAFASPLLTGQMELADSRLRLANLSTSGTALTIDASPTKEREDSPVIELPRVYIPLELIVDKVSLGNSQWSIGELGHRLQQLQISGSWRGDALVIANAELVDQDWGRVIFAGSVEMAENWPIELEGSANIAQPPLWSGLHDQKLRFSVTGNLAELHSEVEVSGALAGRLKSTANVLTPDIPFELAIDFSWPDDLPIAQLPGFTNDIADIALLSPWAINAEGSLASQSVSLTGAVKGVGFTHATLELEATHENERLALQSLTLYDRASESALELAGELSFADALHWDLDISSPGLSIPALSEHLSGRVQGNLAVIGKLRESSWELAFDRVDLRGQVNGRSVNASGSLAVDSQMLLQNSALEIETEDTRLSVSVDGTANPSLDLVVDDLGVWHEQGSGALVLSAQLTHAQRQLDFRGSGQNLAWLGFQVDKGGIEGSYQLDESGNFSVLAELQGSRYNDLRLDEVRISAAVSDTSAQLGLTTSGQVATSLQVNGASSDGIWRGQLEPATVETATGQWQLEQPVAIQSLPTEQFSIADHCWRYQRSRVCPSQVIVGERGAARIDAVGELQSLHLLLPRDVTLEGAAEAFVQTNWTPESGLNASGSAEFAAGKLSRSISSDESTSIRWDRGSLSGSFARGNATVDASLWRQGTRQLAANLVVSDSAQESLSGTLVFDAFDLAGVLKPFFPIFSNHSGELNGNLRLAGSPQYPRVNGLLNLSNGDFSLVGNPTRFEQVGLSFEAKDEGIDLLGQMLVGGGETQVDGHLTLPRDGQVGAQLELHLVGQKQTVLLPPGIEATVSEDLTLFTRSEGDLLELRGNITVHSGILEQEQLPEGSVDLSPDVVEVDLQGNVIDEQSLYDLVANVDVFIEDQFQVIGTGLKTTVGGQLALKKASLKPLQLFGELNILDGEIDVFGQQLDIKRGSLAFVGDPENPELNFRAEREISAENITVGVGILGTLDAISFSLYSTPELPEPEAMSYLLRGRGLDKGANADGAAMALSLGIGAVNRTGVVRGLNKIPGVSDISFSTDGDAGDTTASVSGYLGKRLYLAYGVGIYEPINVLTARLYLQTRLWLEVVSSLNSSADIYYSFDVE